MQEGARPSSRNSTCSSTAVALTSVLRQRMDSWPNAHVCFFEKRTTKTSEFRYVQTTSAGGQDLRAPQGGAEREVHNKVSVKKILKSLVPGSE